MANTKKAIEEVTEKEIPRAAYEGVLTIDVDAQVESAQEQEDTRWHQLLNAHRTRKVLTGQLGGIEKLESGWMVAVTYYNGFRIIIPMNEMMINLSGDGRENADTLNRQVRIANNMLGCDIDFIIKDLDTKSRSGDPEGTGRGGSDETIKGEFSENGVENNISHERGVISMARSSDPDSASSQFFIVQSDSTYLDGQYAAFGHVTEGMDIVDQICKDAKPTDNNGTISADQQPVMTSVIITD